MLTISRLYSYKFSGYNYIDTYFLLFLYYYIHCSDSKQTWNALSTLYADYPNATCNKFCQYNKNQLHKNGCRVNIGNVTYIKKYPRWPQDVGEWSL